MHHFAKIVRRLNSPNMQPPMLMALSLISVLLLAAGLTWYGFRSRQTIIDNAVQELRSDALVLADEADELFRAVDRAQLGLIESLRRADIDSPETLEQRAGSKAVHQELMDRIGGLTPTAGLLLSDDRGRLVNSSGEWPVQPTDDADRDEFHALTAEAAPQTLFSAPLLRAATGQWSIDLGRRFEAPDGRVIGFVLSPVRIEHFQKSFARFYPTGEASFALFRRDGVMLTHYPSVKQGDGPTLAVMPNDDAVRKDRDFAGNGRLTVNRPVAHFPLIVTVSASTNSILRGWKEEMAALATITILLDLLIAGIVMQVLRGLRTKDKLKAAETALYKAEIHLAVGQDRERNESALRLQVQRFDLAMKNMIQGLVVADRHESVLAVNGRFCQIWGLPAEVVTLGMRYTELESLAVLGGNIQSVDIAEIRRRREEVANRKSASTFVWELVDGRAFRINHQPTEEGWLTTYEDISEQRVAEAKIAHFARYDALTDLPNRIFFHESFESALTLARRGHLIALHYLDLDNFKAVNDTLGHRVGDAVLCAIAQRLRSDVREGDTVARLGGDEFAIIQISINSPADATILANRLIELIKAPFEVEGHQVIIGTCIGMAFAPDDGVSADQLAKCADLALHRAKAEGSGIACLYDAEMDAAMQARNALEVDLRHALHANQFELFYQPQIDVQTRRIAGCEALLRWRHPTQGLVSPDQFIPLAEDIGMIVPIGEWVLRQACATAAADWPKDVRVAVNISSVQFRGDDIVGVVRSALRDSGLDASRLELEITETAMLQDAVGALATIHQLRELDVQISMDDFGTGYSSLSYLRRFPFDRIKIDQSFVRDMDRQDDSIAIVRTMITLGRNLGMGITAEGVETRRQLDILEEAGCTEVQGYLFSRPVTASTVAGLLRSGSIIANGWPPFMHYLASQPVGSVPDSIWD